MERSLFTFWMVAIAASFIMLFSTHYISTTWMQVVLIVAALALGFGPVLYEPRLQARSWTLSAGEVADERHEAIIFRTGWYSYWVLVIIVGLYLFINGRTDVMLPRWTLGLGFIASFTSYWVIAWLLSKRI